MGAVLDVIAGAEPNRDNAAAHTIAMRRHPTGIKTSHRESGSPEGSFAFETLVAGREFRAAVASTAALMPAPSAMTVSFAGMRHSLPSALVRRISNGSRGARRMPGSAGDASQT